MHIGGSKYVESKWPATCSFSAKTVSVDIRILASLNEGLSNEWFGIDNISPLYKADCLAQPSSCSGFKSVDMSADGKKVVVVGPTGIAQSLDGGLTWNKRNRVTDFKPKGNHSINNFDGDFVHVTCDNTCSKMVITTQQAGGSTYGNYLLDWFTNGDCQSCT